MVLKIYLIGMVLSFLHTLHYIRTHRGKTIEDCKKHNIPLTGAGALLFFITVFWFIFEPLGLCIKIMRWMFKDEKEQLK